MNGLDDISFLAGSRPRARIVATLYADGPLDRNELGAACDAAATTLSRNLNQLADHGCIERSDEGYDLTVAGELLAEDFLELCDTAELVGKLRPFLNAVPKSALGFDLDALSDATVVVRDAHDPYAPMNACVEQCFDAERTEMLVSTLSRGLIKAMHEAAVEGDAEHRLVVDRETAKAFDTNEQYGRLLAEMIDTGQASVSVYQGTFDYFLGVIDDVVHIGAQDDDRLLTALVESTAEPVREWATDTIRTRRSEAVPFEDDDSSNVSPPADRDRRG